MRKETHESLEISGTRGREIDAVIKGAPCGGATRNFRDRLESEVAPNGCNPDVRIEKGA
jgi:hypothetical protein